MYMKLCNEYPIYMNPTFNEILELANSGWDTIRILVSEDNLLVASGYGNTHETLARHLHALPGKKHAWCDPFILYHKNGIAYMNLQDVGGRDSARYDEWSRKLDDYHVEALKDLIRESNLSL